MLLTTNDVDWAKSEKYWRERGYNDIADACATADRITQKYAVHEHVIIEFLGYAPDRQFMKWFTNA